MSTNPTAPAPRGDKSRAPHWSVLLAYFMPSVVGAWLAFNCDKGGIELAVIALICPFGSMAIWQAWRVSK